MNILFLGEADSLHQQRIARGLAREGHTVVFTGFISALIPGVEVIDLGHQTGSAPGIRFIRKVRRLRRIIRERRIDILHAHYITVYGLLACLSGSLPKILTVHGSDVILARAKRYNRLVIRLVAKRMDRLTSPSPEITEALVALGAPPERIETFQYGVDLDRFHPADTLRANTDALRIISTRRLESLYRVDLLLMALSRMACEGSVTTRIAGGGPLSDKLAHLAWSLQLDDGVRFLGDLDEDAVAEALRGADVYVSTSPTDGASLSLLEAMATGLLPVVPDIPSNREWIRPGENGLLYESGVPDALAEALLHALHEGALREKARVLNPAIIAERACFKAGIQRFTAIYENLHQAGEGKSV